MFAVAIWDAKRRRLVLARDRFGIKPLYYRLTGDSLSFASELKALLAQPDFSREIDLDALDAYLAFSFVPAPLSIFREARKLPPGHVLVWDADKGSDVTIERYAKPRPVDAGELRRGERGGARRGAARAAARLGAGPPDRGRPGRRPALGRDRLVLARGARVGGRRAGAHVHDRLRRARLRRAQPGAPGRRALRDRPPRAGAAARTRSSSCPRCPRPSTSRSRTRRRSRPTSSPSWRAGTSRSRSRARAATSSSAATTTTPATGWRAARAGRAARAPARRAAADLDRARRAASTGRRSASCGRRGLSHARAPLRLEVGLHARGARRAWSTRSAGPSPTRSTSCARTTTKPRTHPTSWRA